jgi:hypothetical protein
MYKCSCGKTFDKKVNYGRHLTVHKNREHIEDEASTEIYLERNNDDFSQDNDDFNREGFMSQDEDNISNDNLDEVSDINENYSFKENVLYKSKNTILVQPYNLLHEKNNQIPYNLISEECYDFAQLVSVEQLTIVTLIL